MLDLLFGDGNNKNRCKNFSSVILEVSPNTYHHTNGKLTPITVQVFTSYLGGEFVQLAISQNSTSKSKHSISICLSQFKVFRSTS